LAQALRRPLPPSGKSPQRACVCVRDASGSAGALRPNMGAGPMCRVEVCEACEGPLSESLSHPSMLSQQLLSAARDGDHISVKVCLGQGADVDARQPLKLLTMDRFEQGDPVRQRGFTPLMYAAQGGSLKCVSALLEARATVNAHDEDGTTSLHLAAASGELGIFLALIEAGADHTAVDDEGQGPIDYVATEVKSDPIERKRWDMAVRALEGRSPALDQKQTPMPKCYEGLAAEA